MNIKKTIAVLYQILFFIVPLILYPYTSELFEFNKIIAVYIFTVLIISLWSARCILEKRFIFKRTLLDIPILIFLISQIFSTIISLDVRTSIFGYYSRFNGGLLSYLSYFTLYYGYVSNMEKQDTILSLKAIMLSSFISSVYGILEHFGIDKNLWIQDVQNRVFSTFGQPNWMAAWLVAVIPIGISLSRRNETPGSDGKKETVKFQIANLKKILPFITTAVFFVVLLFTKSRSGILGFAAANLCYWSLIFIISIKKSTLKPIFRSFIIWHLIFAFLVLIIGTPYTKNITSIISSLKNQKSTVSTQESGNKTQGPALELGGSSSVEIRKIVWRGAIDVWKNYPVFGSGVETFAFSYYKFRPAAHNLVSEWDFLYNKAHNEYLNLMATTGTVGIVTYLTFVIFSVFQISNFKSQKLNSKKNASVSEIELNRSSNLKIGNLWNHLLNLQNSFPDSDTETSYFYIAFLSGFLSILVTNFFGFSVVPVNLLFYLFPAMAITLSINNGQETQKVNTWNNKQKILIASVSIIACITLISISRYWYADILYNKADGFGKAGNLIDSVKAINSAIKLSPKEAIYHDELASQLTDIATVYKSQKVDEAATRFSENAFKEIDIAENLSPNNLNIIRNKARIAITLSDINPSYILEAKKELLKGIEMAPTEAKLYQNLSLTYYRIGDIDKTVETLKKTIELKSNYKDARYAYAIILSEMGDKEEAVKQLRYILEKIDPNDTKVKNALEEIMNPAK